MPLNIHIIMQARVGSSRLPGKILKRILGKTILDHDIERCLRISRANGVIVATTWEPEAEEIVAIGRRYPEDRVKIFRGSTDDVLARHYHAAREFHSDWIIRITSDCPLIDPALVDEMIARFYDIRAVRPQVHLLTNNMPPSFPHGLDAEIFTMEALEAAHREAVKPFEREHVTPFIKCHPERFEIATFSQDVDQSHLRWTLDYPEDFEFIRAVFEELYPVNPNFSRHDVVALLERRPELVAINASRHHR